jgi:hypothetical protein
MRRTLLAVTAGLVLGGILAEAEAQGRGRGGSRTASESTTVVSDGGVAVSGGVHTAVGDFHVSFSTGETRIIREHYATRYRSLPPGLQKKLARGGSLPPGWQKKMEPFPVELDRRLARLPDGYSRGVIDGHAVIYVPGTSVVIDATVLF